MTSFLSQHETAYAVAMSPADDGAGAGSRAHDGNFAMLCEFATRLLERALDRVVDASAQDEGKSNPALYLTARGLRSAIDRIAQRWAEDVFDATHDGAPPLSRALEALHVAIALEDIEPAVDPLYRAHFVRVAAGLLRDQLSQPLSAAQDTRDDTPPVHVAAQPMPDQPPLPEQPAVVAPSDAPPSTAASRVILIQQCCDIAIGNTGGERALDVAALADNTALGQHASGLILVDGLFRSLCDSHPGLEDIVQRGITRVRAALIAFVLRADGGIDTRDAHFVTGVVCTVNVLLRETAGTSNMCVLTASTLERLALSIVASERDSGPNAGRAILDDLVSTTQKARRLQMLARLRDLQKAETPQLLAWARSRVEREVAQARTATDTPCTFVQGFLCRAWAPAMALELVRNGDSSRGWQRLLTVLSRLCRNQPLGDDDAEFVTERLGALGLQAPALPALVDALRQTREEAAATDVETPYLGWELRWADATEVAPESAQTLTLQPVAVVADGMVAEPEPAFAATQLSDSELDKFLVVGRWYYLVSDGDTQRRVKLSWVSAAAGRYIFVNSAGVQDAVFDKSSIVDVLRNEHLLPCEESGESNIVRRLMRGAATDAAA